MVRGGRQREISEGHRVHRVPAGPHAANSAHAGAAGAAGGAGLICIESRLHSVLEYQILL